MGLSLVSAVLADIGDYYSEHITKKEEERKEKQDTEKSKSTSSLKLVQKPNIINSEKFPRNYKHVFLRY